MRLNVTLYVQCLVYIKIIVAMMCPFVSPSYTETGKSFSR